MNNVLKTGFLASALLVAGCMTEQERIQSANEWNARVAKEMAEKQANQTSGRQSSGNLMDDFANYVITGGPLSTAIANSAASQGNYGRANAYNSYAGFQKDSYNRDKIVEGVQSTQQPNLEPKRFEHALGRTDFSFAYTKWVDQNGDKRGNPYEYQGLSSTYSLSHVESLAFQSQLKSGFPGYHGRVTIVSPSGQILLSKVGPAINDNLVMVRFSSGELKNVMSSGEYSILFDLLSPDKEDIVKRNFDKYTLNFVP